MRAVGPHRMRILVPGLLTILVGLAVAGCGDFGTDAATRLGNEIVLNAQILRKGSDSERTFVHHPKSSPEGCDGPYVVVFQESLHHPTSGGSLLIYCGKAPKSALDAYSFTTTVHLNAVRVPVALSVEKAPGAQLKVTLRKQGDTIELVRIE